MAAASASPPAVADAAAGGGRRRRPRRRRLQQAAAGFALILQLVLALLLSSTGSAHVQARSPQPAFVAALGYSSGGRQEQPARAAWTHGRFPMAAGTRWGQPGPEVRRSPKVLLFAAAAAEPGEEGTPKPKPKRSSSPRKSAAGGKKKAAARKGEGAAAAAAAVGGGDGPGVEPVDGEEEEEEEEEEGVEYEYDEESLPAEMRELLRRPSKGLTELLEEAGIEFGDPSLMEDLEGEAPEGFRAGFVTIVGSPNVGKSTLMNALVGERVSIVTSKQQTTRHQIMGVVTGADFQIVYYDTPGVLRPDYKLQEGMMAFVKESLGDADVVLMMTDVFEDPGAWSDQEIFQQLQQSKRPLLLAVNKVDVLPNETHPLGKLGKEALKKVGTLEDVVGRWQSVLPRAEVVPISALEAVNLPPLLEAIKRQLPLSPPLYPNDTLTDKPQRFFASEMIREKIFLAFSKEIPYSCEVAVTAFKDSDRLLKMNATIFTTRESHVPILIGTKGSKLKEVGSLARADLEAFFGKKVYLELRVKVRKDWRTNVKDLKAFGYMPQPGE